MVIDAEKISDNPEIMKSQHTEKVEFQNEKISM